MPVPVSSLSAVQTGRITAQTVRTVATVDAVRLGSRSGRCYASPTGLSALFGGHVSAATIRRGLTAGRHAGILTAADHPDGRTDLAGVLPDGDPYVLIPDDSLRADVPAAVWLMSVWLRQLAHGGLAWPTSTRLARLMRVTERTVERYRAALLPAGKLLGVAVTAARGRRATRYRVTRPAPRAAETGGTAGAGGATVAPTGLRDDVYPLVTPKPLRGLGSSGEYNSGPVGTSRTSSVRARRRPGADHPDPLAQQRPRRTPRRRGVLCPQIPPGVPVRHVGAVIAALPAALRARFGERVPAPVAAAAARRLAAGATVEILVDAITARWAAAPVIALVGLPGMLGPRRPVRSPIGVALWLLAPAACGRVDCAAGTLSDVDGSRRPCRACAYTRHEAVSAPPLAVADPAAPAPRVTPAPEFVAWLAERPQAGPDRAVVTRGLAAARQALPRGRSNPS